MVLNNVLNAWDERAAVANLLYDKREPNGTVPPVEIGVPPE